jgi:hypothetical protein
MNPVPRSPAELDTPERTPLSERMRWDNCICGKGNPNGIGQSGDDWDLDTQCAYCDDADAVAELEQAVKDERAIVDSVWHALGITDYEQAKPYTIAEHVARLRARQGENET